MSSGARLATFAFGLLAAFGAAAAIGAAVGPIDIGDDHEPDVTVAVTGAEPDHGAHGD